MRLCLTVDYYGVIDGNCYLAEVENQEEIRMKEPQKEKEEVLGRRKKRKRTNYEQRSGGEKGEKKRKRKRD
ncbi:hypothetical protein M8J77_011059 [Diaphorina citri]|nr:hypothetical protein M8J77_011059 [Diaphorina citri]